MDPTAPIGGMDNTPPTLICGCSYPTLSPLFFSLPTGLVLLVLLLVDKERVITPLLDAAGASSCGATQMQVVDLIAPLRSLGCLLHSRAGPG